MKMNPVVFFELPAQDRKRMSDFYTHTFGWKTEQLGPAHGNYVVVTTTDTDVSGRPTMPGTINGGFFQKKNPDVESSPYPCLVIAVEDIKMHMKRVEKSGGKILGEPWDIPGFGLYVSFLDTEGNRLSMMQPSMVNG